MELSWIVTIFRTLVLFVLPLAFLIYKGGKKLRFNAQVNKIPGPKPWPLVGNAKLMLSGTLTDLFNIFCKKATAEYGNLTRLWLVNQAQIFINGGNAIEKILQGMQHHAKSENYHFFDAWMGEGLLTSKDDKWRVHRKILTPAFHFNILHEFLPIMTNNSKILVQKLGATPEAKGGKDLNIFEHVSLCALDIICESSMGTVINAQQHSTSPYVQAINRLNVLMPERYFSPFHRFQWIYNLSSKKRELDQQLKIANDFADKVINERRTYLNSLKNEEKNESTKKSGKRKHLAFLDMLLNAEGEGEKYMTQKDIRDQVSTFMFEGHDTVTTATCWALFMMGTHPEIQEKVVEELNQVFGDSGREPTMEDLGELKFLDRCLKETLRLYPSVPFFERYLREDAVLTDGTVIPAGCNVTFICYAIHRDPKHFPNPEKFDPDRFLPENSRGRHPYAYLPFSAGPRNCIGQKFAQIEEKVVVSTVLRKFRIEASYKPEKVDLQMALVLRPKDGLHIKLHERKEHPRLQVSQM